MMDITTLATRPAIIAGTTNLATSATNFCEHVL